MPASVDDQAETVAKIAKGKRVVTEDYPEIALSPDLPAPEPKADAKSAEPRKPGRPSKNL